MSISKVKVGATMSTSEIKYWEGVTREMHADARKILADRPKRFMPSSMANTSLILPEGMQ